LSRKKHFETEITYTCNNSKKMLKNHLLYGWCFAVVSCGAKRVSVVKRIVKQLILFMQDSCEGPKR